MFLLQSAFWITGTYVRLMKGWSARGNKGRSCYLGFSKNIRIKMCRLVCKSPSCQGDKPCEIFDQVVHLLIAVQYFFVVWVVRYRLQYVTRPKKSSWATNLLYTCNNAV